MPARQRTVLNIAMLIALLTVAYGMWEYSVAGVVQNLFVGGLLLGVAVWCMRVWPDADRDQRGDV